MLFSQERVRLNKNQPVKISDHGTRGTILLSQERVKPQINKSKLLLTLHRVQCYFPKKQ